MFQDNPLYDPSRYAAAQPRFGPPVSDGAAERAAPSYDYVIVGSGAAGSVLASRLSECESASVLLLEAGGDYSKVLETKVPLMFSRLFHSKHDWDYYTVKQPTVASRQMYWPRGKVLGGSSSMNAMMHHHASPSDFDEWVSSHGCTGWGYNDLAPYFKSMDNFTPNETCPEIDIQQRGDSGKWKTGYSWLSEIVEAGFLPACENVGIPYKKDVNTPAGSLGAARFPTFIDEKGQRSSLATAYLSTEVMQHPNLWVACNAHVTRVLFDRLSNNSCPSAIGVEFQSTRGSQIYQVHAKREVILCGGSINMPQTLMLSGIGPENQLGIHNISPIHMNKHVGVHLKDHLSSSAIMCKVKPGYTFDYLNSNVKALPAMIQWLLFGSGPLTSNGGESAAFVRTFEHQRGYPGTVPKDYTSGTKAPDLEIIGMPVSLAHHGEEKAIKGANTFSLIPVSLRPQSSGSVSLRSTDVFDQRVIDPKYLSDKEDNDKRVLITGLRLCLEVMRSPSFQQYFEPVPDNDDVDSYWWPYSSSDIDKITDEQLSRHAIEKAFTLYHPVGTARMSASASDGVVDISCRVHGVKRLRIVDASIFAEQISGHPTAAIAAIASKASEIILSEFSQDS